MSYPMHLRYEYLKSQGMPAGHGRDFERAVYDELCQRYGPSFDWERTLPEGLRLELHPKSYYALLQDPDLWSPLNRMFTMSENLDEVFRIPVKVTAELPSGGWRLVIVREDELNRGTLTPEAFTREKEYGPETRPY